LRLQPAHVLAKRLPLVAQRGHVERRRVDRPGKPRRGAFEPVEHLVDARKRRLTIEESLRLQRIGDFRDQLTAHSADVGQRREDPHRRGAEGHDSKRLDGVAGCPPLQKVGRQCRVGRVHAIDLAHLFDQETQRRVDQILVQLRLLHAVGQHDLPDFPRDAGAEPEDRPHEPLRQRQKISFPAHAALSFTIGIATPSLCIV
jgi:hypothetical protein